MIFQDSGIPVSDFGALSSSQKRALFKIAVELVKADNRIHRKEITILDSLQQVLSLEQADLDMVHYMTLDVSVEALKELPSNVRDHVLKLYTDIMKIDSDIDFEENLLLSSIVLSISDQSSSWATVVSSMELGTPMPKYQVVYLEKQYNKAAHDVLDDKYDNLLISKAFGDVGFQLFYLPDVIRGLDDSCDKDETRRFNLLKKSMGYLMPAGDRLKIDNLKSTLESFDSSVFLNVVLSHLGAGTEFFPYSSFILVKVRDGFVLDDNSTTTPVTDFLCIDLSKDVKKRILEFVSRFDTQNSQIPYDGYFKLFFDYLSSESKTTCGIVIDEDYRFCLDNLDMRRLQFESEPQSKSFYMALMRQGKYGISQADLSEATALLKRAYDPEFTSAGSAEFSLADFMAFLSGQGTAASNFLYDLIYLYQMFSTKDTLSISYISYIEKMLVHKNSLKSYVNKAFDSVMSLANADQYKIHYDASQGCYSINASATQFSIVQAHGNVTPLKESDLWTSLR